MEEWLLSAISNDDFQLSVIGGSGFHKEVLDPCINSRLILFILEDPLDRTLQVLNINNRLSTLRHTDCVSDGV
jgi:hypothetical protein